jgi:hypothetical protein
VGQSVSQSASLTVHVSVCLSQLHCQSVNHFHITIQFDLHQ